MMRIFFFTVFRSPTMDVLGHLCLDLAMYNSGLLRSQEWPIPDGLSWTHYCAFFYVTLAKRLAFFCATKVFGIHYGLLITSGAVRLVSSLESGCCIDT